MVKRDKNSHNYNKEKDRIIIANKSKFATNTMIKKVILKETFSIIF
jgi:hypothetical protein